MRSTIFIAALLALHPCTELLAQPAPLREQVPDGMARDLATALLTHDSSLRTLRCHQKIRQAVKEANGDSTRESTQCVDERNRWSCRSTSTSYSGKERGWEQSETRLIYDGRMLEAFGDSQKRATIDEYRGDRNGHECVICWLGREVDPGRRRLGEILLEAKDLHLAEASERDLPVIAATAEVRGFVALIEVEVDPDHGFAPRSITVRDRALRVPYFRYQTSTFVKEQGLWLPQSGTLEARKYAPSRDAADRFSKTLREHHLSRQSNFYDPVVQAGYSKALVEAFGTNEAPSEPLVETIRAEFIYEAVNDAIDEAEFAIIAPINYQVTNFLSGKVKLAGSAKWVNLDSVNASDLRR